MWNQQHAVTQMNVGTVMTPRSRRLARHVHRADATSSFLFFSFSTKMDLARRGTCPPKVDILFAGEIAALLSGESW